MGIYGIYTPTGLITIPETNRHSTFKWAGPKGKAVGLPSIHFSGATFFCSFRECISWTINIAPGNKALLRDY